MALREFVAHVHGLLDPEAERLEGPLAFRLDVDVPAQFDPLWERDLDNYLFPIARTLPERFVSVWGTKGRGIRSAVRAEQASPSTAPAAVFTVERSSVSELAWKRAVFAAVEAAQELPEGPVGLQLAFTIGPAVSWPNLWKPSIDALSRLLGRTYPDRDWNPLDGRIVRLGLHKTIDGSYGREGSLEISASSADETWPEVSWLRSLSDRDRWAYFEQHRGKQRTRIQRAGHVRRSAPASPVGERDDGDLTVGAADVVTFRDDDRRYLQWVAANPQGFVMNIRRGLNPSDARVHRATCRTIRGEPTRGGVWTGPYIKLCANNLNALDAWANARLGKPVRRCGTCTPSVA